MLMSSSDFIQLRVAEAERFLAKDMLAGVQRGDHLLCMQMMACGNDNGVNGRVVENFLVIGSA